MKKTLFTTLLVLFFVSTVYLPLANSDSVNPVRHTGDIWRSKAAFALVNGAIARGLNLYTLSESDYWKLRGPVLLEPQTYIHFQLREEFKRIVNTVDFGASLDAGSPSQNSSVRQDNTPVLYEKAAEIIRDFIVQKHLSVIIMSDAPIGMGEIAAIRGLRGEVRYTYEIINGASVSVPLQNIAALIKQPFITEIWPNSKGNLTMAQSIPQIEAHNVHNAPNGNPPGLGVTGKGVVVGVADTGIVHLTGSLFQNRIKGARNTSVVRDQLHGTHTAAIIGGSQLTHNNITYPKGVAPEVEFLDARMGFVGDDTGDMFANVNLIPIIPHDNLFFDTVGAAFNILGESEYADMKTALEWAANNGADVINLSHSWLPWQYGRHGQDSMSKLIDKLVDEHGIIVVNGAGNFAMQRVAGVFDPTSSSSNFEHKFNSNSTTRVKVTLAWDPGSDRYDLDLALLDIPKGKELAVSRNHDDDGIINRLPYNEPWDDDKWNKPDRSGSDHSGFVYEQIVYDVSPKTDYKVKVEGYNVSDEKEYEVWLETVNLLLESHPTFDPPTKAQTVGVPGYSKKVITVGAVERNNDLAVYSSHGPSDTFLVKPEVVAPGTIRPILVKSNGKVYYSTPSSDDLLGTSIAAPHVAGVAALILDAVGKDNNGEWNFSPAEVKSAIVRGAIGVIGKIPDTPNNSYGAGLVKADNIIFGGTVQPGGKLRFQITPRLVANSYNNLDLDAIGWVRNSIAISWENNSGDLELELLDKNGYRITALGPAHTVLSGSNYEKIIYYTFDTFFYIDVVHKGPSDKPIRFTGASIHPIKSVPHAPVLPNLVAYYPFNGNAADASGNSNHGEVNGNINYVEGIFGKALELSNGEYVEMEATDTLHGDIFKADPFTLSAWIYPKTSTRYGHVWRSYPIGAGHNTLFIIGDEGGISWRARVNGVWSWDDLCETEPGIVKANEWIHVAVTNDGDKFRIYANGEVVAETDFQETDGGNTTYSIGSRNTGETFAGWVDDYAIFSSALSEDEINQVIEVGVKEFIDSPKVVVLATRVNIRETTADVNGDGEVNIQDLVAVAAALGQTGENDADVNGDGEVNIQDIVAVAAALGEGAAAPTINRHTDILTRDTVQRWLTEAQSLTSGDAVFLHGIAVLQQLLAALTPKETALLANYPNPFNPETWIPYQLAKPADVSIAIYAANGTLVRKLDLGHQAVGMYQHRSRAAHWNGKNALGESVASGVYFYTLSAGDFSATRKMLILK